MIPWGGLSCCMSAAALYLLGRTTARNYYYYEFGIADQHVALVAVANSGKVYVSGAAAPELKWDEDGVKLRSAAISLSIL